jgi:hypothetical protein
MSSMAPGSFVNEFQRSGFALIGRQRRDPMFITGACLVELECFADEAIAITALVGATNAGHEARSGDGSGSDDGGEGLGPHFASGVASEQWLHSGMDNAQVLAALEERMAATGSNPTLKSATEVARKREALMGALLVGMGFENAGPGASARSKL